MASAAELLFMCMSHLYVFLGEVSIQVLCPSLIGLFVFLVLSHINSLYILEIKPLSDVLLADMFSHAVSSLFILMMVSLAVQMRIILRKSHLFIFSFMTLSQGNIAENIVAWSI